MASVLVRCPAILGNVGPQIQGVHCRIVVSTLYLQLLMSRGELCLHLGNHPNKVVLIRRAEIRVISNLDTCGTQVNCRIHAPQLSFAELMTPAMQCTPAYVEMLPLHVLV